jgi:CRISPR/Cas system-associated protein Csx1
LIERRKGERRVAPEIYKEYVTFKFRRVSSDFVDAELLNFSPNGIRIKSRCELPFDSTIECLVSVPKSLSKEISFKGKIKYCIQEEPMGEYLIGAEIIETGDEMAFELFLKVHDFIKERIGDIF